MAAEGDGFRGQARHRSFAGMSDSFQEACRGSESAGRRACAADICRSGQNSRDGKAVHIGLRNTHSREEMKNGTAPDNGCSPKFLPLDLFAEKHCGGLCEKQVLVGWLSDLIGSEKGDRADNIARGDDGRGGERKAIHTFDGA